MWYFLFKISEKLTRTEMVGKFYIKYKSYVNFKDYVMF